MASEVVEVIDLTVETRTTRRGIIIDLVSDTEDDLSDDIFGENGILPITSASSSSTATTEVENCVICIGDITHHPTMMLHCGHIFHVECILNWIKELPDTAPNCPICRSII